MKNKKLAYILLPAVALVWGLIIYKVSARYFSDPEESGVADQAVMFDQQPQMQKDTFSIVGDYRDPFLGKRVRVPGRQLSQETQPRKQPVTPPKKTIEKPEKQWPPIVYKGVIKNKELEKEVAIVNINGQHKLLQEGESFEEIELSQIWKDSIQVNLNKESRFIVKL